MNTSNSSDVELHQFFIYNSLFGILPGEGNEEKKVLFYYPDNVDIESKIKQIGFTEAIIQFSGSFKPSEPCSSVHTLKTRQIYFQPEKNYWIVMILNVPFISKTNKEGDDYLEFQGDDVQEIVYQSVLKQAYNMFRLFHGSFNMIYSANNVQVLKQKLELFFTAYLKSLKIQFCDILNIFSGIQFLPLDKLMFLNVQCFVNLLECNFPLVHYTAFLYNDRLIWSGIEPNDMQTVYHYLVSTLLPAQLETEIQGGSMPRHNTSPFSAHLHHGKFITGPPNLKDSIIGKVPKVYLNCVKKTTTYHLVVYRLLSASVCLFIEGSKELSIDHFRELDAFMGPELLGVVSGIGDYCTQQSSNTTNNVDNNIPKFIYFNKLNLAYKSTVHLDNRQSGNVSVSQEALRIMVDLYSNKLGMNLTGETIVKTMNDYWIVRKLSNLREFYIVIHQKNASLGDINDEVKKLCDSELKGIFFHPS